MDHVNAEGVEVDVCEILGGMAGEGVVTVPLDSEGWTTYEVDLTELGIGFWSYEMHEDGEISHFERAD